MNPIIIILIIITIVGVSYYMYSNSSKDTTGSSTSKNDQKEEIQREKEETQIEEEETQRTKSKKDIPQHEYKVGKDWINTDNSKYEYNSNSDYTIELIDLMSGTKEENQKKVANIVCDSLYYDLIFLYVIFGEYYLHNKDNLTDKNLFVSLNRLYFPRDQDAFLNYEKIFKYIKKEITSRTSNEMIMYKHLSENNKLMSFYEVINGNKDLFGVTGKKTEYGNIILKNKNFLYLNDTTREQINKYKEELVNKFSGIDFNKIINYVKELDIKDKYTFVSETKYNQIIGFEKNSKQIINIEELLDNHFGLFREDFDRSYDLTNQWEKYVLLKYKDSNICQIYLNDTKNNIRMQGIIQKLCYYFYLRSHKDLEEIKKNKLVSAGTLMISIVHHILLELRKKYKDVNQTVSVYPKFSDAWKEKLKKYNKIHKIFDITG